MMVLKVNAKKPAPEIIRLAARIIQKGGLVVYPTETVYGLGANAFDRRAVRKIFKAKGRPEGKPLIVLIGKKSELKLVAKNIPPLAHRLIKKFWPGPLTLVLEKAGKIPPAVTAHGKTIAVRFDGHPAAQALVRAAGTPITAPSANLSGRPPHRTMSGVLKELGRKKDIALFLDAGKTPLGTPSTILDLTQKPPVILREGNIKKKQLMKFLDRP